MNYTIVIRMAQKITQGICTYIKKRGMVTICICMTGKNAITFPDICVICERNYPRARNTKYFVRSCNYDELELMKWLAHS